MNQGIFFAFACYGLWGFLPIYWKLLKAVPSDQILAHRIVWSLVFMLIVLTIKKDWEWLNRLREDPKLLFWFSIISALISLNWFIYIWAVNNNFIVEASLGYFINPLVNVSLGVLFLKERLRSAQWIAVGLAFVGVSYLTYVYGRLPWIALSLAFSFAFYGLLKKMVVLGPLRSLTLETFILFLPAAMFLVVKTLNTEAALFNISWKVDALLILAGVATGLPLLFFGAAAKQLSMTALGLMQYLAPTIQFFIGVIIYKEQFSSQQFIGFFFIWSALIIFTFDVVRFSSLKKKST